VRAPSYFGSCRFERVHGTQPGRARTHAPRSAERFGASLVCNLVVMANGRDRTTKDLKSEQDAVDA